MVEANRPITASGVTDITRLVGGNMLLAFAGSGGAIMAGGALSCRHVAVIKRDRPVVSGVTIVTGGPVGRQVII